MKPDESLLIPVGSLEELEMAASAAAVPPSWSQGRRKMPGQEIQSADLKQPSLLFLPFFASPPGLFFAALVSCDKQILLLVANLSVGKTSLKPS